MGTLSKLFITAFLILVIGAMYKFGIWDDYRIAFYVVSVICVLIGYKLWID